MTPREKRLSKDANMRLWRIFYYDYFDYPKCFEYLAQAREIADEAGIEDANIYIGLGCMYQTISEETDNFELGTQALDYYIMALDAGLRTACLVRDVLTYWVDYRVLSEGGYRVESAYCHRMRIDEGV